MPKKKLTKSARRQMARVAESSSRGVSPAECLRIVAWNVGHRTRRKPMHASFHDAVAVLDPDLLILTEYVHDDELRASLLDSLKSLGLTHTKLSVQVPRENGGHHNQVLAACRVPLHLGDIRGPAVGRAGETNFLHVRLEGAPLEVIGMRVPDYKEAAPKRRYWSEFAALASEAAGRQIVFIGDMNADPDSSRSLGGRVLLSLRDVGWHIPRPAGRRSFAKGGRIDHVLAWRSLPEAVAYYISEASGITLMGSGKSAVSDHAALVVDFPGMLRLSPDSANQPQPETQPTSDTASDRLQEHPGNDTGTTKPRRFEDVTIEFLSFDDANDTTATVIDRGQEMVIEIKEDGKPSYTVVGRKQSHYYVGREPKPPPGEQSITARWTSLGDVYVGIWWEKGNEYVISFRLED